MCDLLSSLEHDLRRAAERHQFAEVQRLAEQYCAAADRRLRSLPRDYPGAPRIARNVAALLEWTLLMLYSARESCRSEARRVSSLRRYGVPLERPSCSVRLDG